MPGRCAGHVTGLVSGELGDEVADAGFDVVAYDAHGVEALAGGGVALPVLGAFAGGGRAGVGAPHRDEHIGGLHGVGGERRRAPGGDVDVDLAHGLAHAGV